MADIRTPKGKQISVRRYLALTAAQQSRCLAYGCVEGHLDCAAWAGGPCSTELGLNVEARRAPEPVAKAATCPDCGGSDTIHVGAARTARGRRTARADSFVCRPCNLYFEATNG